MKTSLRFVCRSISSAIFIIAAAGAVHRAAELSIACEYEEAARERSDRLVRAEEIGMAGQIGVCLLVNGYDADDIKRETVRAIDLIKSGKNGKALALVTSPKAKK